MVAPSYKIEGLPIVGGPFFILGLLMLFDDDCKWNISTLATVAGLHRDTVRKRINEAGLKQAGKKGNSPTYHASEAMQAIFANQVVATEGNDPTRLPPKDRLHHWQAESERVKFAQTIKELVPAPEVRDDLAEVLKTVAGFFESLPDKLERKRLFSPVQLETIETLCDEFREVLYEEILEVKD